MYGLPQTTEIKKQLPKKAIYAKFDMKPAQRDSFDADISRIDIVAMLSPRTIPALAEGEEVKEIYVLSVQLKKKDYDTKNIALLSKLIPHKMVFALHYEDEIQFAIFHTKLITSAWQLITHNSPRFILGRGLGKHCKEHRSYRGRRRQYADRTNKSQRRASQTFSSNQNIGTKDGKRETTTPKA